MLSDVCFYFRYSIQYNTVHTVGDQLLRLVGCCHHPPVCVTVSVGRVDLGKQRPPS